MRSPIYWGYLSHVCLRPRRVQGHLSRFQKAAQKMESLGDALPLIITRLCEPKEASYNLIKKYLEQHFPNLNIENR